MNEIYLAGGCFWGVQKYFNLIFGILKTEVGYANGKTETTNYQKIAKTNHAETVHIIYNPRIITLDQILNHYYEIIDPTSLNKQGNDIGPQYRLGIYYTNKEELPIIINSLENLQKQIKRKIVIETKPLKHFIKAEKYHQNFLKNNPFAYCHINIKKFEEIKLKQLEIESYRVMKLKQTEPPFNNKYYNNFQKGIYVDKETEEPLFSSKDKYNAKTGYPTFEKPITEDAIIKYIAIKNLTVRVGLLSKQGRNHLGYLYYDSSKKRYSINSASLRFIPKSQMETEGFKNYLKYLE